MKKILFAALALGVCAYFVYSANNNRIAKQERERSESAQIKSIQNSVLSVVQRNNAFDDWDIALAEGESIKIGPVMTIDLERLWLQDRPIMFSGLISDIKTYDTQNYTVTIKRNVLSTVTMISVDLRLELRADKKLIDAFIEQWPQVKGEAGFDEGVAVIAKISSIRTDTISGEDSSTDHLAIGEGLLVDLAYAGDVPF